MDAKLFIFLFSAAILLPKICNGHGMLCHPRQRAAYHDSGRCGHEIKLNVKETQVRDYCGHCLNGGAKSTVRSFISNDGWRTYNPLIKPVTLTRAGLCGDPRVRVDHMIGGSFMPYSTVPIMDVWKVGSVVDFAVEIDTNHNGYFEFHLCDLDSCGSPDIAESCFHKKKCYRLERVPHPDCEDSSVNTNYECGPIDAKYPHRWYVPCRNTGHVGVHLVGGESGTMRYKLPDGVTCKHCVLQWYWATANSCNPPGFALYFENYKRPFGTTCASDGGARGACNPVLPTCGENRNPEEFWSCADVQISTTGQSLGTVIARAKPSPGPKEEADDGDRAKTDPDKTIKEGKENIEEDIGNKANETKKEEKQEERQSEKGKCLLENDPCDASVPCCDSHQVCVYTLQAGMFTCRFWWGLWKEAHDQDKLRNS